MTSTPRSPRRNRIAHRVDPTQYTPCYAYRPLGRGASQTRVLYCENTSLDRIADTVGTPAYVYSRGSIEAAYRRLDRAFGSLPHTVCYAVKANGSLSVLNILAGLGSSFDIVSVGELDRLRRIGIAGDRIVFSGVGKTRDEIREALRYPGKGSRRSGILLFNIESRAEFEVLLSEAARHVGAGGKRPSAAIRVNPDVLAGGHRHISTGHHDHKFGMDWEQAQQLYLSHKDSRWIAWRGISAHLGSQILTATPYRRALALLVLHVRELARNGIRLDYVDIGGGLGIRYSDEHPLDPGVYARTLGEIVRPLGCRLLVEPGRTLVGPAGVLLTRVIYVKKTRGKTFVIVDAAMNDLIRPVLYESVHRITKAVLVANSSTGKAPVDVVGPVCESGDFLARDLPLEPVKSGDVLVVWAAGAYGFVASSNYNARRRPPEILVEGFRFRIARSRQTYDDLVRGEAP